MKNKLSELRITIDALAQLAYLLKSDSHKDLYLAKAWLGRLLLHFGSESPYAKHDGNRKTIEDIEPTDSKVDQPIDDNSLSNIEKIDILRTKIKTVIDAVSELEWDASSVDNIRDSSIARTNAYTHLCEARFELGFDLERIREQGLNKVIAQS